MNILQSYIIITTYPFIYIYIYKRERERERERLTIVIHIVIDKLYIVFLKIVKNWGLNT